MRNLVLALTLALLATPAVAVEASIQPSSPDDIVLDSGNSYDVTQTFDGTASSGEVETYSWNLLNTDQSDTGPEAEFDFDRESSQTETVRLTVSNGSGSDVDEVTQVIHDVPNASILGDSEVDFDSNTDDTIDVTYNSDVTNEFDTPVNYNWTLDGEEKSTSDSVTISFDEPTDSEDFDLELNVTDDAGYSGTESLTVTTDNETDSSSSSSEEQQTQVSGGAGGSGGSDIESGFDETRYLSPADAGDVEEAEFDELPVTKLGIELSNDVSEIWAVQSRTLDSRPDEADSDPSGEVYEYMEFNKINVSNDDISEATFSFEVEKSWIQDNSIKEGSVTLQRYDDGWETLSTEKTGEASDAVSFEATSSGFSFFSITGEKKSPEFTIRNLSLNTTDIDPGESVKIDVEVENNGNANGSYTVSVDLPGEKLEETVELEPGGKQTVTFETSVSDEGSYDITVGDRTSNLQVGDKGSEGPDSEQSSGGFPWLISGFVLLIVLTAGGALVYHEKDIDLEGIEELKQKLTGEDADTVNFKGFGDIGLDDEDDDDSGFEYSYD